MNIIRADVQFKLNEKLIKFSIVHNLPKISGLSFNDALNNWLVRTKTFTAKSLCKYIMSKNHTVVAMTEKQYKRLSNL